MIKQMPKIRQPKHSPHCHESALRAPGMLSPRRGAIACSPFSNYTNGRRRNDRAGRRRRSSHYEGLVRDHQLSVEGGGVRVHQTQEISAFGGVDGFQEPRRLLHLNGEKVAAFRRNVDFRFVDVDCHAHGNGKLQRRDCAGRVPEPKSYAIVCRHCKRRRRARGRARRFGVRKWLLRMQTTLLVYQQRRRLCADQRHFNHDQTNKGCASKEGHAHKRARAQRRRALPSGQCRRWVVVVVVCWSLLLLLLQLQLFLRVWVELRLRLRLRLRVRSVHAALRVHGMLEIWMGAVVVVVRHGIVHCRV